MVKQMFFFLTLAAGQYDIALNVFFFFLQHICREILEQKVADSTFEDLNRAECNATNA